MTLLNMILVAVLAWSCQAHSGDQSIDTRNINVSAQACLDGFSKDSAYVCCVARGYVVNKIRQFQAFNDRLSGLWTDTIVYSHDCRRCMALIISRYRDTTTFEYFKGDYDGWYFGATAIVGLRQGGADTWSFYPFDYYLYVSGKTKLSASRAIRRYYFDEIANASLGVAIDSNKTELIEIKYPISDTRFWSDNVVWRKNYFLKDLFDFQIDGNTLLPGAGEKLVLPKNDCADGKP